MGEVDEVNVGYDEIYREVHVKEYVRSVEAEQNLFGHFETVYTKFMVYYLEYA